MEINTVADTPLLKDCLAYNDVCYFITKNHISAEGTILLNSNFISLTNRVTNATFITGLKTLLRLLTVGFSDDRV